MSRHFLQTKFGIKYINSLPFPIIVMDDSIDGIEDFLEYQESRLSKAVKLTTKFILRPFLSRENRDAYQEQFSELYRNLELMVGSTLGLIKHRWKSLPVARGFFNWGRNYFGAQRKTKNKKNRLIYSNIDHEIEFKPEEDTVYIYMLTQMLSMGNELIKLTSPNEIKKITACFRKLNQISTEVYQHHQTVMPRFTDHDRIGLKLVQMVDRPLNCCPSLHISESVLLYIIAKEVLELDKRDQRLWQLLRTATKRIIPSVSYTKQHAYPDISFGILGGEMSFNEFYPEKKFNAVLELLYEMQAEESQFPYGKVLFVNNQAREKWLDADKRKRLDELVGEYLDEKGYPFVRPDETMAYWDLEKRELVSLI